MGRPLAPAAAKSFAAFLPALPKPWTATVAPCRDDSPGTPPSPMKCSATNSAPWAVAVDRPGAPPKSSGLPVTTGRLLCPGCIIEYVS